ncbi:hypothetical protein KFK09_018757 [Dendrobium nobile]|uniref:Uncharacterized protein n=1 Tax=Dendrobium nobile TaxID=94219 RepID=A0A8T3AVP0_DENNO|nr:hypothetical protein KFK09_018757 [Dendrobium nobile]
MRVGGSRFVRMERRRGGMGSAAVGMGSAVGVPSSGADRTSGGDDRASDREREGKSENEMSGARGLVLGFLPAVFWRSRPPEQNYLSPAV